MGRTGDMTTDHLVRLILEFAIPLFIGNIFQQIYSIVDTMSAGAIAATVIAQGISVLCAGSYVVCKYKDMLLGREHFRLEISILKEMAVSGFVMAVMLCVVDLGSVIYQQSINSLDELLIVAHTVARRLIGIFMMPFSL